MFPGISRLPDFTRMKQDMRGGAGEGDRHLLGCNFFFPALNVFHGTVCFTIELKRTEIQRRTGCRTALRSMLKTLAF